MGAPASGAGVDAFVSYTGADEAWAVWVAGVLEAEGQTVVVRAWDSPAGTNFVTWTNRQMTIAKQTVAICSQAYFASHWCTQEWAGALAGNTLTPLRVERCAIPPVLDTIAHCDLYGIDETTARRRLMEAVGLARPQRRSGGFPGRPTPPVGAVFPGRLPPDGPRDVGMASPAPSGAVRVTDANPYLLGIHRPIRQAGTPTDVLPAYVERDADRGEDGVRGRLRAAARQGGFVLLVGASSVGKTRSAYEAVRVELPGWWLHHPADAAELAALAGSAQGRLVVWLDEVETYLDGDQVTGGTIRALLGAAEPIVLIGTIRADRHASHTLPPTTGEETQAQRRRCEVLRLADTIRLDTWFSDTETARAHTAAAGDPRLAACLRLDGRFSVPQHLAAAPALDDRWADAEQAAPYAWAVITAALDATRLGAHHPLAEALLRDAAEGYCDARRQAQAPTGWFTDALSYATAELHGATGVLNPVGAGMGVLVGHTPADYLQQQAAATRRMARIPASLWTALCDHLVDPDDISRVGAVAYRRLLYGVAVPLLRAGADAGDGDAAFALAQLLRGAGCWEELRDRADHGDDGARIVLLDQMMKEQDRVGLQARAAAGDSWAAQALIDLDGAASSAGGPPVGELLGGEGALRAQAAAGDRFATRRLVALYAWQRNRGELRVLADAGHREAEVQLVKLLVQDKNLVELRARADRGIHHAAYHLSWLLVEFGELQELRTRADRGEEHAGRTLARQLIAPEHHKELRTRADRGDVNAQIIRACISVRAGDHADLQHLADLHDYAAYLLARFLAVRGDHGKLKERIARGDLFAPRILAALLAQHSDDRLQRYGFALDGTIATRPTW
ncbi:toll/interleukin-1 receptor domain-containing protein [Frankia tisae]|uniref:toll/interleukin-1 receptor domain-containing protein n=1 Tax=Frankia tisae TaxID=2950104 RepID=UPI0021BEC0AD|nr:toll/interleukin-1 receptor domain-containing protein [Frankia tisae]